MRDQQFRLVCLIIPVVTLLTGSVAFSQAPPLDIPDEALNNRLLSAHEEMIRTRIQHYADLMKTAENEEDIFRGRQNIIRDYNLYQSTAYRFVFAREAAEVLTPLLKSDPKLQINASIVLANLPQVTIQPALEEMVTHQNPAVRYLGWKGYSLVRSLLLAQGQRYRKTMFDSLTAAAKNEDSPVVLRALMRALRMPQVRPQAVATDVYANALQTSFEIYEGLVDRLCRQTIRLKIDWIESADAGLATLNTYLSIYDGNQAMRTRAIQLGANLAKCAFIAYQQNEGQGKVARAAELLLKGVERYINQSIDEERNTISGALDDEDAADSVAAVGVALADWLSALQKDHGVKEPSQYKPVATQPAETQPTQPATNPGNAS
ncbi:MAG: HEAT repeat domain-containing protein [Phycisphaerae bacterium]